MTAENIVHRRPSEFWDHVRDDLHQPWHQRKIDEIARSITEHGYHPEWRDHPMTVSTDPEVRVSDGNHTLRALQQLGLDEPIPMRMHAGAAGGLPEGIAFHHGGPNELPDVWPYRGSTDGEHEVRAEHEGKTIGQIKWLTRVNPNASISEGHITFAGVHPEYHRRGVATEMLRRAREVDPRVHHSHTLTSDGRAWAERTAGAAGDDYGDKVRFHHGDEVDGERRIWALHQQHGSVGTLDYEDHPDHVRVNYLYVPPDHRRHGVGTALMRELEARNPGKMIDHADRTDEGEAWARSTYGDGDSRRTLDGRTAGAAGPDYESHDFEHIPGSYHHLIKAYAPGTDDLRGALMYTHEPAGSHYKTDGPFVSVEKLHVEPQHRRRGTASALMAELERIHPGQLIDHGSRSDDGRAWSRSYYGNDEPEDHMTLDGRTAASVGSLSLAPAEDKSFNKHVGLFDIQGHGLDFGPGTRVRLEQSNHPDINHQLKVSRTHPNNPPFDPRFNQPERREDIGWMSYHPETGRVEGIRTSEQFQRQGVATSLWSIAKGLHQQHGLVAPQHSETQTPEGRAWAERVGTRTAAMQGIDISLRREAGRSRLSDEARVSVAEDAMEQGGYAGREWHVPRMHVDDPAREEAHRPVNDYVHHVLTSNGWTSPTNLPGYQHRIKVKPSHWDLREPGSGQAITDGMNYIGIKGERTNDLTLLHECAHILTHTHEGPGGHGQEFQQAAHDLYHRHIGPEAAATFRNLLEPSGSSKLAAWDRSGGDLRWTQPHHELVRDAMYSWRGDAHDMRREVGSIAAGRPLPDDTNGTHRIVRAQAEALHAELQNAQPISKKLYRGAVDPELHPSVPSSWSENPRVAEHWAKITGGTVHELPAGVARGVRMADHIDDPERQWLVVKGSMTSDAKTSVSAVTAGANGPDYDNLSFKDLSMEEYGGNPKDPSRILFAEHPHHGWVGRVHYDPARGLMPLRIHNLSVNEEHQRRGVASQLMGELERRNPDATIDHGMRSPDGTQWAKNFYGHEGIGGDDGWTVAPNTRNGHEAARFTPTKRVFTHTCGLDHRLWAADSQLKPEVRSYILKSVATMWQGNYADWTRWSKVYFAGSEASEWTSEALEGNNDFDVLIGVDYRGFRRSNPDYRTWSNQRITDQMNQQFRSWNGPMMLTVDGIQTGPWDRTSYVNPDSYDIRKIKPYAAYDVGADRWVVRPPHLPHWSLQGLPAPVVAALRAAEGYAKSVLKLPEPERTQQGAALFDAWHSDRSRAFGPNGEGWYDIANLREKWGDQQGWWADLVACKKRYDQGLGAAPADWSNTPPGYTAAKTAGLPKTQKCEYCSNQATQRMLWAEGMAYIPVCDEHLQRAKDKVGADEVSGVKPIPKTAASPTRAHELFGAGNLNRLFPVDEDGPKSSTMAPWPEAGRRRDVKDYEPDLVREVMTHPDHHHMVDVDPRELRATQPKILRAGVQHYLDDTYDRTGTTYADQANPGNRRPVIYHREDGQQIILSGHHRAAAALLKGQPLQAVVVKGPWGPPRRSE